MGHITLREDHIRLAPERFSSLSNKIALHTYHLVVGKDPFNS